MSYLGDVPCGSCHACCHSELVVILPEEGDAVADYEHEIIDVPGIGPYAYLKHKKNGECIYLDAGGCSIRERRPHMCRIFDCRAFYLSKTRAERRKLAAGNPLARVIFAAGRERLDSLDRSEIARIGEHMGAT